MEKILTDRDLDIIVESLTYSIVAFQNYNLYPNEDFRKNRINDIENLITKIKSIKNK